MDKIKMVADGVLLVMGLVFATSFIVMGVDVVTGYAVAGVAASIVIVAALVSFVAGEFEERKEKKAKEVTRQRDAARHRAWMEAKMQTASVFQVKVLDADTGEIKWGRVSAKTQMEAKMKVAHADNGSGRYAILSIEKI